MPSTRCATLALYILALCVLVQEVTLTRVFSVMSWHAFAYLIISLALLGFGTASYALGLLAMNRTAWEGAREFAKPRAESAVSPG